jgi:hypothetical protein
MSPNVVIILKMHSSVDVKWEIQGIYLLPIMKMFPEENHTNLKPQNLHPMLLGQTTVHHTQLKPILCNFVNLISTLCSYQTVI